MLCYLSKIFNVSDSTISCFGQKDLCRAAQKHGKLDATLCANLQLNITYLLEKI